jgi:hypothetical protein
MRPSIKTALIVWSVFCGLAFFPALIWIEDRAMVVLTYGWSGYRAGIRVASDRPLRFTTGELIPHHVSVLTGFGIGLVLLAVMLSPGLIVPLSNAKRQNGNASEAPS